MGEDNFTVVKPDSFDVKQPVRAVGPGDGGPVLDGGDGIVGCWVAVNHGVCALSAIDGVVGSVASQSIVEGISCEVRCVGPGEGRVDEVLRLVCVGLTGVEGQ